MNNAGLSRGETIAEGSYHDNKITLETNLVAPFLLTKEFLPYMIQCNHGHIVNISSMSAYLPPAGLADYGASKAGLVAMHEVRTTVSSRPIKLTPEPSILPILCVRYLTGNNAGTRPRAQVST